MRGPLGVSVPPTTAGSAATALDRSRPPRSDRLAAPLLARSGRSWASAGAGGHGSVSGRDNRRSSGSWMMPASSPVGARYATRITTRVTGGGGPAPSQPSHRPLAPLGGGPSYEAPDRPVVA